MSNVSKFDITDPLMNDEVDVLDDLPSSNQLRCAVELVGDSAEPVDRLLGALESAERRGLVPLLVAVRAPERAAVGHLIESMLPQDPPAVPSRAQVLQARRNAEARLDLLREFGYLTAEQIAEGRSRAANRSALAGRWRSEGKIFGVEWKGRMLYPGFQFDEQGASLPVIANVLAALPRDRMSDWELALWWASANGWLSGDRPVDRLNDSDKQPLVDAARHLSGPSPL